MYLLIHKQSIKYLDGGKRMLSRKNRNERLSQSAQRNNHFSIRKLTVGAASVLLGTSLYLGIQTSQVHAADVAKADEKVAVVNNDNNKTVTDSDKQDVTTKDLKASVEVNNVTQAEKVQKSTEPKEENTKSIDQVKNVATAPISMLAVNKKVVKNNANQTHHVKVTAWDDSTDSILTSVENAQGWNNAFKNGVYEKDTTDKGFIYNVGAAPTGYKLMNPEAVTDNFNLKENFLHTNGHDVDITLLYAPLSPVLIEYVNEENGDILSYTEFDADESTSESLAHANGVAGAADTSRFTADAIDIPGYELVSKPEYVGYFNQTQLKDDENPIIVQFKYKKITKDEDPVELPDTSDADSRYFDSISDSLPGGFIMTHYYENGVGHYDKDLDQKVKDLIDQYKEQGYSYAGTTNYHKGGEIVNSAETETLYNLVPNMPVNVYYLDKNGKELHKHTVVESNVNNPDQTNHGIDYDNYWYPEGQWSVEAKDIPGYVLTKTYGATSGSYVPYDYHVIFVYTKKETKVPTTPPVDNKEVAGAVWYIDDTTNTTLDTVKLEGEVGQKIDYNTKSTIKNYEEKGYELVSSDYKNGDETFTNGSNVFEVHFKHGTTPVNPEHPGAGYTSAQLQHDVTRTITYVANGQDKPFVAPKTVKQTVKFTAEGTIDNVTGNLVTVDKDGKIINQEGKLTWTSEDNTLDAVDSPVVNSYHVVSVSADSKDGVNVDATSVNRDSNNINVVVTYEPNKSATVPPLEETKPEAAIDVIKYINDTTEETMAEVKVAGEVGKKVDYSTQATITQYEKDGYKFVSSNFENGKEVYVKGGQTFEVHFTKAAEPVVPTTPTDSNPTPEPHPEPNPDTDVPDIPAPEVPSVDVPMPHPQTPEVPEEPDETPAPHATTPETPVSEDEGEVPVVHASDNEDVPMPHAAQDTLPQTGEKTSVMVVIAGAVASVLGIFGLASRRKEDK